MRKKWSVNKGISVVVFLANLTAFAASEEYGSRSLHGGWNIVFLGRNIYKDKLSALTSQCVTTCWNTGNRNESRKRFHLPVVRPGATDYRCSLKCSPKCCHSGLQVAGAPEWSFCCGYLVFGSAKRTGEQWKHLFPLTPPTPICFEGGRSWLPFLQRYDWRGGYVACHFWEKKNIVNVGVEKAPQK